MNHHILIWNVNILSPCYAIQDDRIDFALYFRDPSLFTSTFEGSLTSSAGTAHEQNADNVSRAGGQSYFATQTVSRNHPFFFSLPPTSPHPGSELSLTKAVGK